MSAKQDRVFALFGKPYRWVGTTLARVPDDEARCPEVLVRPPYSMRCHLLTGHDGKHRAERPES